MLAELTQLRAGMASCVDAPAWALPDANLVDSLDAVHRLEQAVAAVKLHLVREVDARSLPVAAHAYSTAGWLRERLRVNAGTARWLVSLARELDQRPGLDEALGAGRVNSEQVTAIVDTLTALPADLGTEAVDKAETLLVGWAEQFEARSLRRIGARILEHVAPEVAERAEAARLAREEARAVAGRAFTLSPVVAGRVRLSGWLDTEAAAIVSAALDPLCSPRRSGVDHAAPADERTPAQRRADALVEICQLALNTEELPVNGGDRPQVHVTIDFEALRRQVGAGTLDTGDLLTPTQVRRMACDAQILPAVLGGQGQVLDVGQTRRLFTGPLRRALVLRDRGCAFPGCDRPPRWCDGHHIDSWIDGGPTCLSNAVLLCRHHHRLIHHTRWTVPATTDYPNSSHRRSPTRTNDPAATPTTNETRPVISARSAAGVP